MANFWAGLADTSRLFQSRIAGHGVTMKSWRKMWLVAVTRTYNDDGIVEAFVRHHAPHVARFLFLDHGSTDRTLEILQSLRDEGKPITVVRDRTPRLDELGEFVTPKRMGGRHLHPQEARETFARGGLGLPGLSVDPTAREVSIGCAVAPAHVEERALLAHYPRPPIWQVVSRNVMGRLRALAAGHIGAERDPGTLDGVAVAHFRNIGERTARNGTPGAGLPDSSRLTFSPLGYHGGELPFTRPTDHEPKYVRLLTQYAKRLSAEHSRPLNELAAARELSDSWYGNMATLF